MRVRVGRGFRDLLFHTPKNYFVRSGSYVLADTASGLCADACFYSVADVWPSFWGREPVPMQSVLSSREPVTRISFPRGFVTFRPHWNACRCHHMWWFPRLCGWKGNELRSLFPYGMPAPPVCKHCAVGDDEIRYYSEMGVRSIKQLCLVVTPVTLHARGVPNPQHE